MKKRRSSAALAAILASVCLFSCANDADEKEKTNEPEVVPTNAVSEMPVSSEVTQPIVDYYKGFMENEPTYIMESTVPDVIINAMKEGGTYESSLEQIKNQLSKTYEFWIEDYGENVTAAFDGEVSNTKLTKRQLELAELSLEYQYYGLKKSITVKDGYEVTFKYYVKGDKDTLEDKATACFINVADRWIMMTQPASALNEYVNAVDPFKD